MQDRLTIVAALVVSTMSVMVTGCGSSKPDAAPPATPVAHAAVSADMAAALNARLVAQDGALAQSAGHAEYQTAQQVRAASDGQEPSADRLDAAARQRLTASGGNAGVRVVFHFPDAATALADFNAVSSPPSGAKAYKIPGIPHSAAFDETGNGGGDRNLTFVVGPYEYRLGFSLDQGATPTHAQFVAMAKAWYRKLKAMG